MPQYKAAWLCKKLFVAVAGTAGSGKSSWAARKLLFRLMVEKCADFLALRKVGTTCRDSVFKELKRAIVLENISDAFDIKENEMRIICRANGNQIKCTGCDDVDKFKSIVGVRGVWFEEATDFERDDIFQFVLRMRGQNPAYKQLILTFNKNKPKSWIKADFFDENKYDAFVLKQATCKISISPKKTLKAMKK